MNDSDENAIIESWPNNGIYLTVIDEKLVEVEQNESGEWVVV